MSESVEVILGQLIELSNSNEKTQKSVEVLEQQLSEKIEELAQNSKFYKLKTTNLLSIIRRVDFSKTTNTASLIQSIIKNSTNEHFIPLRQEKEAKGCQEFQNDYLIEDEVLLLKSINCDNCKLSIDDFIHIFDAFKDCNICVKFVQTFRESEQRFVNECETKIQEKDKEIKELQEKLNQIQKSPQKPAQSSVKKPLFFEPDVFKAIEKGKLSSVQYIIEHDHLDINTKNEKRQSLLYLSLLYNRKDIYSYLAANGATKPKFTPVTEEPVNYEPNLLKATKEGKLTSVQYLIEQRGMKTTARNEDGWTLLHYACFYGHLPIVQYLIEVHCADEEEKDHDGLTPLHIAARNGFLPIVKYLCQRGVNKDVRFLNGSTPLHFACQKGHLDIVQYLCEQGVDKEAINNDGWAPLHWACDEGHLDVVQYLIEKQNVNKEVKFVNGSTPLHFACQRGHLDIVQYLIEKQNVDKTAKSEEGFSPIHWACDGGNLELVKYLIEKQGANKEEKSNENATPLHIACNNGHISVVQYLIEQQHVEKEPRDINGMTPLHMACKEGHVNVAQYLIDIQNVDKNTKTNKGKTPLDLVTDSALTKYLTSIGAEKTV